MIRIEPKTGLRLGVAALMVALGFPLRAGIDPMNPNATLYERPPTPAGAANSQPPVFPELKQGADGYWIVDFRHLASFAFAPPAPDAPPKSGSVEGIPQNVRALEGKHVCISGYLLPLSMDDHSNLVKEFLIIRSPMVCCYGVAPKPNEWVVVKMKGQGIADTMDMPMNFYGTLHVGQIYEDGAFAGLYRLDGEKAAAH
ncbi:MAG TPA: DUF3299 domain-containing protein [Opitutaceae bacterium]|jgi:hypothetical protein|nr:DUF3299 domain-containing protein [Opitutaceae bacterium]